MYALLRINGEKIYTIARDYLTKKRATEDCSRFWSTTIDVLDTPAGGNRDTGEVGTAMGTSPSGIDVDTSSARMESNYGASTLPLFNTMNLLVHDNVENRVENDVYGCGPTNG